MQKIILNCGDRLDLVQFMRKNKHYNDTFDCIGAVYVEKNIELWWLIWLSANYDKNKIGQWHVDCTNAVHVKHKIELLW